MTLAEDIAATQTIPGCRGVLDLMDRIEEINKTDPYEARRLYFKWKILSKAVAENPEIWLSPGVTV